MWKVLPCRVKLTQKPIGNGQRRQNMYETSRRARVLGYMRAVIHERNHWRLLSNVYWWLNENENHIINEIKSTNDAKYRKVNKLYEEKWLRHSQPENGPGKRVSFGRDKGLIGYKWYQSCNCGQSRACSDARSWAYKQNDNEMARTMIIDSSLPRVWWGYLILYATIIRNIWTTDEFSNKETPYKLFFNKEGDLNFFRRFECT